MNGTMVNIPKENIVMFGDKRYKNTKNSSVRIILDKEYTDAGKYELKVPAGIFECYDANDNDIYNGQFDLFFEISPVEISPMEYETVVGTIDGVYIFADDIALNKSNKPTFSADVNGTKLKTDQLPVFQKYEKVTSPKNGYMVVFQEPWQPVDGSAVVNITIPANTFTIDGTVYNKSIPFEFIHRPTMPDGSTWPVEDKNIGNLSKVVLYWTTDVLEEPKDADPGTIKVTTPDSRTIDVTGKTRFFKVQDEIETEAGYSYTDGLFIIDLSDEDFTAAGEYKVELSGNNLYDSSYKQNNNEQTIIYNVVPTDFPAYTVDLQPGKVESIGQVNLSWDGYEVLFVDPSVALSVTKDGQAITTENKNGETEPGYTFSITDGKVNITPLQYIINENGTATKANEPWAENGVYTVTLPAATILLNVNDVQVFNAEPIELTYRIGTEYLDAPETTPESGKVESIPGEPMFAWPDVEFDFTGMTPFSTSPFNRYRLDKNKVHVYVNGEENTAWRDWMGADVIAYNSKGTRNNDSEEYNVATIKVSLGDMARFFLSKGEIKVTIDAELLSSTEGLATPEAEVMFYLYDADDNISWEPVEDKAKFEVGDVVFYASWLSGDVTKVNTGGPESTFIQLLTDGVPGPQISIEDKLSEENGKLKFDLSDLEAGSYSLTLVQGAVNLGEETVNGEAYYNFLITEPAKPVIPDWTSNIKPNEIKQYPDDMIQIIWGTNKLQIVSQEGITVKRDGEEKFIAANIGDWSPWGEEDDPNWKAGEDNVLILFLDVFIGFEPDGVYTVHIPAGAVNILVDGNWVPNEEINFSYTVDINGGLKYTDLQPIVTPACDNGKSATVYELSTVTLSYGDFDLAIDPDAEVFVRVNNGDRKVLKASEITADGNTLAFDISAYVDGLNTYELTIPDGAITFEGENGYTYTTTDITLTYILVKPELSNIHIEFTDDNDQVGEIHEKAETDDHLAIKTTGETGVVKVNAPEGFTVYYKVTPTTGLSLLADAGFEAAEDGIVNLPIGKGTVEIYAESESGARTNSLSYSFEVGANVATGISFVGADADGLYRVYNLQGVNVLNTRDASDLGMLENGLYIINGKKVVIRK